MIQLECSIKKKCKKKKKKKRKKKKNEKKKYIKKKQKIKSDSKCKLYEYFFFINTYTARARWRALILVRVCGFAGQNSYLKSI